MRWRRWRTGLTILAALGALAVAGRLLDVGQRPPSAAPPAPWTPPVELATTPTAPRPTVPTGLLRRVLRLPGPPRNGSCPTTPPARDRRIWGSGEAAVDETAVALGDGPVYPLFLKASTGGGSDRHSSVYWVAPKPLGGVAIVRGHRLGAPGDRVRFQDEDKNVAVVKVLDPSSAGRTDTGGHWWPTFLLRVGVGCYGMQIDGPGFSRVVVVEFRA